MLVKVMQSLNRVFTRMCVCVSSHQLSLTVDIMVQKSVNSRDDTRKFCLGGLYKCTKTNSVNFLHITTQIICYVSIIITFKKENKQIFKSFSNAFNNYVIQSLRYIIGSQHILPSLRSMLLAYLSNLGCSKNICPL